MNLDGSFVYTPTQGFNGVDSFTYLASDGDLSDMATVFITVTGTNHAPVAVDDVYSTDEDVPLVVAAPGVLENDGDDDGDPLEARLIDGPAHGTLLLRLDGSLVYTPTLNWYGSDSFTYRAHDGLVNSNLAAVDLTVVSVDDAPDVLGESYTTPEDTPLAISAPGLLANDSDIENDPLFSSLVRYPDEGEVLISGDGSFVFTPSLNFYGLVTFSYVVTDTYKTPGSARFVDSGQLLGISNSRGLALGDLDGDGDVDAFVANDWGQPNAIWFNDGSGTLSDSGQRLGDGWSRGVALGDVDGNGSLDAFVVGGGPNKLWLNDGAGTFADSGQDLGSANSYDVVLADLDGNGSLDAFIGNMDANHVWLNDGSGNFSDSGQLLGNSVSEGVALGDLDGNGTLDAFVANQVGHANRVWLNDGSGNFSDNGQMLGSRDAVGVDLGDIDGDGDLDAFVVNYNLQPDEIWLNNGGAIFVNSGQRLGNFWSSDIQLADLDYDGDLDALVSSDFGQANVVWVNQGGEQGWSMGTFSDTLPALGGSDSRGLALGDVDGDGDLEALFANDGANTVWINLDDWVRSELGLVEIDVTPVPGDPPEAVDDYASTPQDTPRSIAVLGNDSDPDGDDLTVIGVTQPLHGTASTDGTFVTYTPEPDYIGTDVFEYTISDPGGLTDMASVYVDVGGTNDPPDAVDDSANTAEDTATTIDVLANDSDPNGDALLVMAVGTPAHGSASIAANMVVYTPFPDYYGPDSVTYVASDGALSDTATIWITVTSVNDPPVALDDAYETIEETPLIVAAPGVLGNDSDPVEGDPLTAVLQSGPARGELEFNPDGSFVYTPTLDFDGTGSLSYVAHDGLGHSNLAMVWITVTNVNDAPVAMDDSANTAQDTPRTIAVLGNDFDPDGDSLSIVALSQPAHGSASTDGTVVVYTPTLSYSGTDTFAYTIADPAGLSDTASVTMHVGVPNNPPEATDDVAETAEDTPLDIDVLGNDSDPDGDTISLVAVELPANGTAAIVANNMLRYTPTLNFNGSDSLVYTISDGDMTSTATVHITVTAVNDPPVAVDDSYETTEDSPLTVPAPGVLANDSDPVEGDALTAILQSPPSRGTLQLNGDGSFSYTPLPDDSGQVSFSYYAYDGADSSDGATVTITITPVNDPPAMSDIPDQFTFPGTPAGPIAFTVWDAETPLDELLLSAQSSNPALVPVSNIVFGGSGLARSVTITPLDELQGTSTITLTVSDGSDSDSSAFVLTVNWVRPGMYEVYLPLVFKGHNFP